MLKDSSSLKKISLSEIRQSFIYAYLNADSKDVTTTAELECET